MRRALLACLTAFFGCGCLCGGCPRPDHNYKDNLEYLQAERDHRQKLAERVVEALEKYKDMNGQYPDSLEALVTAGQLPAVPDLASNTDHLGKTTNVTNAQPLKYAVTEDGYELRFSFGHFRPSLTAADSSHFLYSSRDKKWYLSHGSPAQRSVTTPQPNAPPTAKAPPDPKKP